MLEDKGLACLIVGYLRANELISLTNFAMRSGIQSIYIAIDGPKSEKESKIQLNLIQKIRDLKLSDDQRISIRNSKENHGAAVSIISAIDWVSLNEDKFLILEDDLVPGEDLIPFISEMLSKYQEDDDVLFISGNRFFQIENPTFNEISIKIPLIWGWGTNRKKWSLMKQGILDSICNRHLPSISSSKLLAFLRTGAARSGSGQIDAWDLPLAYWMVKNKKHCVLPPVNLITNIGSDSHALHTKLSTWPLFVPTKRIGKLEILEDIYADNVDRREERLIEEKLFGVRFHHIFSSLYYPLVDLILRREAKFSQSLGNRLKSAEIFEGFELFLTKGHK
jgi:hypothetical protein